MKPKKLLTTKKQQDFTRLLADLLRNGLSIQESLLFMEKIDPRMLKAVRCLQQHLANGDFVHQGFAQIGFSNMQVAQLSLATVHGDLIGTLQMMAKHAEDSEKQKATTIKLLTYPVLLLSFLLLIMSGMKWILLPQMAVFQQQTGVNQLAIQFIQNGPTSLLLVFLFSLFIHKILGMYLKKKSAIQRAEFIMKIPIISKFYKYYYTSFFSFEWGKLLEQGFEMKNVIEIMEREGTTELMKEMTVSLKQSLEFGDPLHQCIGKWRFLFVELSQIIQQGELKGKLGSELLIYGDRLWLTLLKRVESLLKWVQPIIFLFIALLIIGVYGSLLLPIYQEMEGIL